APILRPESCKSCAKTTAPIWGAMSSDQARKSPMKLRFILLALTLMAAAVPATAQEWPTGTMKIVVPFGPGSTPDTVARLIAEEFKTRHPNATFVVENKPGASGNLGTDAVAKAKPDGSTIGISIGGPLAINTLLFSKLPYNPKTDIAPITQLITQPS